MIQTTHPPAQSSAAIGLSSSVMTAQQLANVPDTGDEHASVLGILPADERVDRLAARLTDGGLDAIHAFGLDIGAQASLHTDAILEQASGRDLDAVGGLLSEVVSAAQQVNVSALARSQSRIPLIGPLIDRFRIKSSAVRRHFDDVRTQIDSLLDEIGTMREALDDRNRALEDSFESVRDEIARLEEHMSAGRKAYDMIQARAESSSDHAKDPLTRQGMHDLRSALASLEKRIADMQVLQHSALQQLPMIRLVQTNNRALIEKFHTINTLTVPAWKRQFMLALSLNEQKNAVRLADTIDDATNEFLRQNARLLKENTLSTAKANQRLVIDIDTLRSVHDSLLDTMQQVVAINDEGSRQRQSITRDLHSMREALANGKAGQAAAEPVSGASPVSIR